MIPSSSILSTSAFTCPRKGCGILYGNSFTGFAVFAMMSCDASVVLPGRFRITPEKLLVRSSRSLHCCGDNCSQNAGCSVLPISISFHAGMSWSSLSTSLAKYLTDSRTHHFRSRFTCSTFRLFLWSCISTR